MCCLLCHFLYSIFLTHGSVFIARLYVWHICKRLNIRLLFLKLLCLYFWDWIKWFLYSFFFYCILLITLTHGVCTHLTFFFKFFFCYFILFLLFIKTSVLYNIFLHMLAASGVFISDINIYFNILFIVRWCWWC